MLTENNKLKRENAACHNLEAVKTMRYPVTNEKGFTLVELLITLTIAAIVMAFGIPSLKEMIRNNQLTAYANEVVSALNYARSEAVKRGASVTVRRADQNSFTDFAVDAEWESGWDVFLDQDGDGIYEADDTFLKAFPGLKSNYTLRTSADIEPRVTFLSTGGVPFFDGYFVICETSAQTGEAEPNTSKLIYLTAIGRVEMMKDTDDPPDGIPNKRTGENNFPCDP